MASTSFSGSVTVTDNGALTEHLPVTLQVLAAAPLNILTTTLPAGGVTTSYGQPINVQGGLAPYTWAVTSGSLAGTGLALNSATGVLSGTPATSGTLSFSVTVTDQLGGSVAKALTLQVLPQVILTGITNGADSTPAPLAPGSLAYLNGTGLATGTTGVAAGNLPFTLGGVTVTVNGIPTPISSTSASQLLIQIPYATGLGTASVVVSNLGILSNTLQFQVVPAAVGIFNDGAGHATETSLARPADAGIRIAILVTGLGSVTPAAADGVSAPAYLRAVVTATATVGAVDAPVSFAGAYPTNPPGWGIVQIRVPALPTGVYPLVITANGVAGASQLLYVQASESAAPPPVITSLDPALAPVGSPDTQVRVSGRNFTPTDYIYLTLPNGSGTYFQPDTITANQLTATIPLRFLADAGPVQVRVIGRQTSNTAVFTVTSSQWITSVTPSVLSAGSAPATITVTGRNFLPGSTLSWTSPGGTITPLIPTLVQPGLITATGPASLPSTGTALVRVVDPSGNSSNPGKILIQRVALSVTPASVPYGSPATSLTINGSGFAAGSTLLWTAPYGGNAPITPTLVQAAQIAATLPPSLLTSAGTAQIAVSANGTLSNTLPFIVSSSVPVTAIAPSQTLIGSGNTPVTITGSAFTPGSVVKWSGPDGQNASISPTLIQAAQIAATLPASLLTSAGTAQVSVMNGAGALSNLLPFSISPFTITSVTPNSASTSDPSVQIAINGSNLGTAYTLNWTGPDGSSTNVPLTQQGTAQVLVTVPATLLATPGTALLSISNSAGRSNALPFTIAPLDPLSIRTTSLAPALTGTPYSATLSAAGGSALGPYTWQFVSPPPSFLALSPGGALTPAAGASFLPANAGSYTFTVQVTDLAGNTATRQLTLNIYSGLTITTTSPLRPALATQLYSLNLAGIGGAGTASYRWSATGLPAGLTLSAAGLLSGTPASATTVNFIVTLTDGVLSTGPVPFTLPVDAPTGQIWTQLNPTGGPPSPRYGHASVYDASAGQMLVFGGSAGSGALFNDLWTLKTATNQWSQGTPGGTAPAARTGMSAAYDSAGSHLMIFGGGTALAPCNNDVWVLNNAGGSGGTPSWTPLNPVGTAPAPRVFHQAAYDAASNRLIVFGGNGCGNGLLNDVWVLSNANGSGGTPSWTQLAPGGTAPSARANFSAVFDAAANQLIVYAGAGPASSSNDVWVLSNANGLGGVPTWAAEAPGGTAAPALSGHTAILDSGTNRMTVFGGRDASNALADTWMLTAANGSASPSWSRLAPAGTPPAPRNSHSSVYDATANRMLVFGGTDQANTFSDVWALSDPNAAVTISSLSPSTATVGGSLFTLSVYGQGFALGAAVRWNGAALATIFVSPSQLTATVPANLLTSQGSAAVTVLNPNGTTSAASSLSIQPVTPPTGGGGGGGIPGGGFTSTLTAASTSLTFNVPAGSTPATQSLTFTYQSASPVIPTYSLNLSTVLGSGWLYTSPPSGSMVQVSSVSSVYTYQATVNVLVNPAGIAAGSNYPGTVTIVAGGLAAPVSVLMNVIPAVLRVPDLVLSTSAGKPVSGALAPGGGTGPYKCAIKTGSLPAGVSLNTDCSVSGSPTQAGSATATVTATDSLGATGVASVTVNVLGLITSSLPPGAIFQNYSTTIAAAGGSPPYLFAAAGLPTGLSLSGSGVLSGSLRTAPAAPISVTVTVTDSKGQISSATYTMTFSAPVPIVISFGVLPDGVVNTPYSQTFTASGGNPPYMWSVTGGAVPAGLSLSASGTIAGMPAAPGPAAFTVQAADSSGGVATVMATLTIRPAPLTFTTRSPLPSGVTGLEFPSQTLGASGGTPPYTFVLTSGSLPSGMSLTGGLISGTPGAPGDFPITVTVSDSATPAATAVANLSLNVRVGGPDLTLSTGNLSLSVAAGAGSVPPSQNVAVQSTVVSQNLAWTAAVSPASPWLSFSQTGTTPGVLSVGLANPALALPIGSYQANVVLTCMSTTCSGKTQTVAVSLTVTASPALLNVPATVLSFSSTAASPQSQSQDLTLQNIGGGRLTVNAVSCGAPWCSVSGLPSALTGGASAAVTVTADPSRLASGFYRTSIDVSTSGGHAIVPATFLVSRISGMTLSSSGAQFPMQQGTATGNLSGSVLIGTAGSAISWTATVQPGADWLTLGTLSGASTPAQPGTLSFSINPAVASSLAARTYYGVIRIDAAGVVNAPQDFQVILTVHAPEDPVRPDPQPAGLVFLTAGGASPSSQPVSVYVASRTALAWTAATDGSPWLSVTPSTGFASAASAGGSTVAVNAQGLAPGIYRGGVSYALGGATVRTVSVMLVVSGTSAAASGSAAQSLDRANVACGPSLLAPAQTGLPGNFTAVTGRPAPMLVRLVNDCGAAVAGGGVTATFSNGDAPLVLAAVDTASGIYAGTWVPRNAASQVTVTTRATAVGLSAASVLVSGSVTAGTGPQLAPHGTVNAFNPQVGGGLAPGTIIAIYGTNLSSGTAQPDSIPLPAALAGSSVLIAGLPAPLFYVSPGQINAQVPFELDPAKNYQVVVQSGGALTTPESIQLTPAAPSLAVLGDGTLLAQHGDGSLVSPSSPARPGEFVVAYLLGMGATDTPVPSGSASPGDPLARPAIAPVLTIGGNPSPVAFAGLTPGLVGLYQMNFQVPPDAPDGNLPVVVSQADMASNPAILPVHQ